MRITLNPMGDVQKSFYFVDERADKKEFLEAFSKSYSMQKNYYNLEKSFEIPFGDSIIEGNFVIYNIDLLQESFTNALKLGMHNRWNSKLKESFDPALQPSFYESLVTQEDLERIESTLYAIYKRFGEVGLTEARRLNLAQAICDSSHHIEIEDLDDLYDLEKSDKENRKLFFLDDEVFDPITRAMQAIGCKAFLTYPNENVKSALFAMPYLLYKDSHMVSEQEIMNMLLEIESKVKNPTETTLDRDVYYDAVRVCCELFVKNNKSLLPRKKDLKQYKISNLEDK